MPTNETPQQRSVSAMQKAIEALKMVEPYSDQLTCYTSTAAEWPLNNLPAMVSVAINELQDSLNAAPAAPQPAQQPLTDDPCPGCQVGKVCRTPKCGRLELPVDHPLRTGVKP